MRIWVYSICRNEAKMMPFYLRHYSTFADKIVVYDERSDDGTRELLKANPRVEVREWRGQGLDDERFLAKVNSAWIDCNGRADWMIFADIDELLWHPNILSVLGSAKEDAILARGLALISPSGFPVDDGRQIYDAVRTGHPQRNYDKFLCWRPGVPLEHTIGRHTYPGQWPRCRGALGTVPKLKLFHCHHVGGVDYTAQINRRNFDRAVNKKFAWNYTKDHDKPNQVGTVSWVQGIIQRNRLVDVLAV